MTQFALDWTPPARLPGPAWIVATLREYERCMACLAPMYPRRKKR